MYFYIFLLKYIFIDFVLWNEFFLTNKHYFRSEIKTIISETRITTINSQLFAFVGIPEDEI